MSDFKPLGKPIRSDPEVIEDEWEPFRGAHGTNMKRNKRTGAICTDQTPKGPQYPPSPWDAVLGAMKKQQDDGFPLNEFGIL